MNEETRYTPLAERLNQDVIHDNFIPKYSALASAQPSKLVLTGVWLIFGPMSISAFALPWFLLTGDGDFMAGLLYSILMTLFGVLALAILITQTRRFTFAMPDGNVVAKLLEVSRCVLPKAVRDRGHRSFVCQRQGRLGRGSGGRVVRAPRVRPAHRRRRLGHLLVIAAGYPGKADHRMGR